MTNSWITVCPLIVCLVLGIEDATATRVNIKDFPWQAAIIYTNEQGGLPCGGTIIDKKYVVTSGFCTGGYSVEDLSVAVGSSIYEQGTIYTLKSIRYPNGTGSSPHQPGISVIELNEEIQFNETTRPIALPYEDLPVGTKVTVTGWGEWNCGTFDEHLKKRDLTITNHQTCATIISDADGTYNYGDPLHSSQVCGVPDTDTPLGQGTIGSGVVYNKTLVGISQGVVTCDAERSEKITLVREYVTWIRQVSGN